MRLTPRAGRDAIDGWRDDVLMVRVAAPPAEGAANASLIRLLAKQLRIAPSKITLVSGAQSRTKIIEIEGVTIEEMRLVIGEPTGH